MEYYRKENDLFVRLDPREYLVKSLTALAEKEKIEFAIIVSGVGMIEGLKMGWFCINSNDFDTYTVAGIYDLNSISGNIATFNEKKKAHIHIVANHPDFSTVSGHLIDCQCRITMEIGLKVFSNSGLERKEKEGRPATFITSD